MAASYTLADHRGAFPPDATSASQPHRHDVRFSVLGPLQIWVRDHECAPRTPKVLQVLAMLLVRANRTVETESLINELWGERPPRSALTTIQTYIYQIRKLIERQQISRRGEDALVTRPPGYLLRIPPEQLDFEQFRQLRHRGRTHLSAGEFREASAALRGALALWSENPLSNVKLGPQLEAHVADLQEQMRITLQSAIESEMNLGLHRELIGELRSLIATYPLDEWFHQQLMLALDRSGRRSDALHVYRNLRGLLNGELGIDPSEAIQNLHRLLLE
jgi:DNA-binding SARP family transcriptional activator